MVQFLRRLLTMFRGFARGLPQRGEVEAAERISRYILSKRYFNAANRTVKYAAYLPAPNGETSVYRASTLPEEEIWKIGQEYVAKPSKRTLYARGDTTAAVILKTGLDVIPETTPHPLHANILNWPSEKDEKKMFAIEIVNEATLAVCPY